MKTKLVLLLSNLVLATSLIHVLNGQTPDGPKASHPEAVLASQLISAKTEEERVEMLRANKPLVNPALLIALADEASRLEGKAPMQEVERVNSIRLSVAESLGNKPEILEALLSLGNSMQGASKVETYKRGLALSEEYQDLRMTSRFVMAIGGEHPGLDGRLEYYVRALQIAEDINDLTLQGNILGRIGNINTQKGDYIAARSYHTRALEIRERVKDLDGQSITHSNLGILEQHQGDLDAAISHFAKAIEISEGLGNKFGIAIDSYNLGNAYLTRRDFTRAMSLYARSLDVSEELKCRGCAIGASINVANLYVEQGNAEQARFYIRKAVDTDDEQQYPANA
jgi:tetratricopeptide (TPR) repeat protein